MGETHPAREEDEETVEEEAETLGHLVESLRSLVARAPLVLAPLETLLGLHRVDDVGDDSAAHRHGDSLVLTDRRLVLGAVSLVVVNLTVHCLLVLKLLDPTLLERVAHLVDVRHRAVAVTLSIFSDACVILLSLFDHNLLLLRADMLRLDVAKLRLVMLLLGGAHVGRPVFIWSVLAYLVEGRLGSVWSRELAVLRHAN